jgi:hypothetical protein
LAFTARNQVFKIMKDLMLQAQGAFPAASGNTTIGYIDIGVDNPNFSEQWREGRLRLSWPALPNFTSNTDTITVTLQDSQAAANPLAFTNTNPAITGTITGVAATGPGAGTLDMPLPPGLRGPFQVYVAATAGAGNNTQQLLTINWVLE